MKIYNKVVLDMGTLEVLEEDSFEYEGPMALCCSSPSMPKPPPPPKPPAPPPPSPPAPAPVASAQQQGPGFSESPESEQRKAEEKSITKANKKGVNLLRIDLSGLSTQGAGGLNIPK